MKLTEKQKRFCDYYIESGNGAEAARKAGYKGKNHEKIASENLIKLDIKEYIAEKLDKKDKKRIASQDEILEYFTKVMRGQEKDVFTSTNNITGEIIEEKVYPTLKERTKAAENLAKRYGIDKPKSEIEDSEIEINITDSDSDED